MANKKTSLININRIEMKAMEAYSISYLRARRVYLSAFNFAITMGTFKLASMGAASSNCNAKIKVVIVLTSKYRQSLT